MSGPLAGVTVLLDQDGPLADFDAHFHARCLERGWTFDDEVVHPRDFRHRFATDHLPDPRERTLARRMVDTDHGWFSDLPVTPGAVEGVDALRAAGADVWVVTKPLERNPRCRDGKAAWLRRYLPELETRLIIAPDKSMVRGDVLVDDAIKLDWLPRAAWRPVVFPAGYNGPGSQWGDLPRWTWSDGPARLAGLAGR